MRGPPVVLTNTLGRPVTNVISERGAVPMTVVNTLGEPVTLVASGGEPVTLFNPNGTLWDYPFSLFANNEQGAWYDPSDYSTLFQNAAGTTPVTAVEQPVRLMLDRSRGLVLGGELFANQVSVLDNSGGGATVVHTAATRTVQVTVAGASTSYPRLQVNLGMVTGRRYSVTGRIDGDRIRINSIRLALTGSANGLDYNSSTGVFNGIQEAGASPVFEVLVNGTSLSTITIAELSVRELPGNHATAPNDASRPVLRARYNQITFSEQFDDAAWQKNDGSSVTANAVVAPDGTTTADQIDLSASELSRVQQALSGQPTASYTFTVWLRVASGSVSVRFGHSADIDVITVTDTWQRFTSTKTVTSPSQPNLTIRNEAGGGAKTLYAWGAQLLTSADQTSTGGAYQRIAAATDYDTSNPVWRPYLAFDGSDDSLSTSAIDFSGTDKMTVFAGVTKLSDAAFAVLMETTTGSNANNGAVALFAPSSPTTDLLLWRSRGTAESNAITNSAIYSAPVTVVVTGTGDISGDVATLRINGAQVATSSTDQGTGNYANAALFIGRRNNTSAPFNGRLYSLAVLGRTATAAELSAMEAWVNGKTGAY